LFQWTQLTPVGQPELVLYEAAMFEHGGKNNVARYEQSIMNVANTQTITKTKTQS